MRVHKVATATTAIPARVALEQSVSTLCTHIKLVFQNTNKQKTLVSFHASTFRLVAFCNTEIDAEQERKFVQLLYSTVLTEMFAVMSKTNELHCISFPLYAKLRYNNDAMLMQIKRKRRLIKKDMKRKKTLEKEKEK